MTENFGHPELAVITCDDVRAHRRISRLVDRIESGTRLDVGHQEVPGLGTVACHAVSTAQLASGLIAMWPDVADRLGWEMVVPEVLQIDPGDLLCTRYQRVDWDLSLDAPQFTGVTTMGGGGFPFRRGSGDGQGRQPSAAQRGRRVSGDPRNRPRRWAP